MVYLYKYRKVLLFLLAALLVMLAAVTTTPAEFHRPPLQENPYSPGDFQFRDGYLTCTAGEALLGIDVSEYQLDIDWDAVRSAGVEFVFIRVGWRGTESGSLNADKRAQEYYKGAKAAGLQVGAYFFSQAVNIEEAREEANYALSLMKGWQLELPVVFDWEYAGENTRSAHMDRRTLTDCTRVFCRTVENAGYEAMFYFNASQGKHLLHLQELTEFPFWLAQYENAMTFPYRVDFWQYTGEGTVDGIQTPVDLNLWLREGS
jgi:GH25 family lysozyme M1 (1,4-beta-N-acetylmuramidase)